ncbi:hypothetical protein FKR81_15580 [Lentzea tibetensis]|uniref:PLL-like beta propeller domain-containing protein n=1 Tax=Lentzea tibetensis TaxID=2591470 RepID=A0A563EV88_9PSEU|nr:hypothetical protein [Lentzea tibetensis]TWP51605.1 hypothetical protein FKR81_15580 [Lentzea tibetensis]
MNVRTTVVATSAMFAALLGAQAPAAAAPPDDEVRIQVFCGTYSSNQTLTRSQVIARAQSWIDQGVDYNQDGCHTNQYATYRKDCSGHTSMAWGLTQSHTTWTLHEVSREIPRSDLKPGDALNKFDEHVAIFAGWSDAAKTKPIMLNHGGPGKAHVAVWSADYAARFKPIRYNNIVEDAPAPTNDAPSVSIEKDVLQVFASDRGTGKLVTNWQNGPRQDWKGWTQLNTGAVGTPSSLLDHEGQMNVFARRSDGHLVQMWQDGDNGAITKFKDLGGDFAGDPVAVRKPDNVKVVFIRGTDGQLWHKWQNSPIGDFQPSQLVHTHLGQIVGKPSVLVDAQGRFTVFVLRADGHLITLDQSAPGGEFTQHDLLGDFAGDPVAVRKSDGAMVVFIRGTDGQLWHKWQNKPGQPFVPSELVRDNFGQVLGAPAATIKDDLIQVFARRNDGHMITAWQYTNGGKFDGVDDIGGDLAAEPVIGRLADGAMSAFARFNDGSTKTTWQKTAGAPFEKTWSYLPNG